LKGKTKHSIKNSEDFVKKIEGLEIPPPRVLVSYDVSALFTSIPIEEAIRVIHKRLSFHKPFNTIRNLLVRPKDKNDPKKTCGIIYNISCPSCKETYIGETGRNLETRLKEHLDPKSSQSAVQIHTQSTGHLFNQDSAKIIGREDSKHRRKILEAIEIHKHQPQLNLNQGKSIPPTLLQLLSDRNSTCQTKRQCDVIKKKKSLLLKVPRW